MTAVYFARREPEEDPPRVLSVHLTEAGAQAACDADAHRHIDGWPGNRATALAVIERPDRWQRDRHGRSGWWCYGTYYSVERREVQP